MPLDGDAQFQLDDRIEGRLSGGLHSKGKPKRVQHETGKERNPYGATIRLVCSPGLAYGSAWHHRPGGGLRDHDPRGQEAEALGYHSIWLFDHFHTVPNPTQEVTFECWTSTAALARDTQRIRIGQMVTCYGYRNPALLAKMASTVDIMSHGRLTLGIGAGWHEHEFLAYGYDFADGPTRLRQLREAVQVILAMWTQEHAVFEGDYYHFSGTINHPRGVQKPHIPLLIGGGGEQVTLKLVRSMPMPATSPTWTSPHLNTNCLSSSAIAKRLGVTIKA